MGWLGIRSITFTPPLHNHQDQIDRSTTARRRLCRPSATHDDGYQCPLTRTRHPTHLSCGCLPCEKSRRNRGPQRSTTRSPAPAPAPRGPCWNTQEGEGSVRRSEEAAGINEWANEVGNSKWLGPIWIVGVTNKKRASREVGRSVHRSLVHANARACNPRRRPRSLCGLAAGSRRDAPCPRVGTGQPLEGGSERPKTANGNDHNARGQPVQTCRRGEVVELACPSIDCGSDWGVSGA